MASSWLSAGLGLGLGGSYGLAAYAMGRLALRHERERFLALCAGGMILRMAVMLAAVGGVAALVPVRPLPFATTLIGALLAGLAVEVVMLRRARPSASASD